MPSWPAACTTTTTFSARLTPHPCSCTYCLQAPETMLPEASRVTGL